MRVIDLELARSATVDKVSPLLRFPRNEPHLSVLIQMQLEKADVALVEDRNGHAIGLLYADQLADALFQDA